ncbi:MAG: TRAP transporter large permease [Gemmobacter sp.]
MTPLAIGIWCSVGLLVLMLLRIPIAVALILTASAGIWAVQGSFAAFFQLAGAPINSTSYGLSVIPLFILMGNLAVHAGLSRDLFALASRAIGRLRGGLAVATILGCAGFSALSGSSLATAATMGKVTLGEMHRRGYSRRLASGSVAAGGTIGILIPPSVMLAIYALMTEQSIRDMFAAGLFPGLMLTGVFVLTVLIWVRLSPGAAPSATDLTALDARVSAGGVLALVGLVVLVLGGLYGGFFTPTEAAAVGAIGTFAIALVRGGMGWPNFREAMIDSATTSGMIFLIIIGSTLYGTFLAVTGIAGALRGFVGGLDASPMAVLVVILLIYVVLGFVMDALGMLLLTLPVLYPIVIQVGIDPILFGVLVVMAVELGLITPPLGMNVFVVRSIAPDTPLSQIFAGAAPFALSFVVAIGIVLAWPALATWLPGALYR